MKRLKQMPLSHEIIESIENAVEEFFSQSLGFSNMESIVANYFKGILQQRLTDLGKLGLSVIGLWEYNDETNTFDYSMLHLLVDHYLQRYRFILQNFESEYARLDTNLIKVYSGKNNGTRRSAAETSPITGATINSSPASSAVWDLRSPTSKAGSQYDNSNNSTETIRDPAIQKMVMEFQVNGMNLPDIVRKFAYSLVDEYNTIY